MHPYQPGDYYPSHLVVQPTRPASTVAVWALITGVVGVLAGWCLLGVPCIAAVVLGHVGMAQTKDGRLSGRGMAVAGLVLGYVALIPAVILFFWMVLGGIGAAVSPSPEFTNMPR